MKKVQWKILHGVFTLLLVGCCLGVPCFGVELRELTESIHLNPDGTGNVEIRALVIASASAAHLQTLELSCPFREVGPITCTGTASASATVIESEGVKKFQIEGLPLSEGENRFTLGFSVKGLFDPAKKETEAFGSIPVAFQHVHTLAQRIGTYSLFISLPEGQRGHSQTGQKRAATTVFPWVGKRALYACHDPGLTENRRSPVAEMAHEIDLQTLHSFGGRNFDQLIVLVLF